jgi:hypothetical protein
MLSVQRRRFVALPQESAYLHAIKLTVDPKLYVLPRIMCPNVLVRLENLQETQMI